LQVDNYSLQFEVVRCLSYIKSALGMSMALAVPKLLAALL
jgi:hypothetical protein